MTLVRSRIVSPSGEPLRGITVDAGIIASASWTLDKTSAIAGRVSTTTGDDGWWELEILPYDKIEGHSDFTFAVVHEYARSGTLVHWIRVPESKEPVLMRDLLVDDPTLPPPWRPMPSIGALVNVDPLTDHADPGKVLMRSGSFWAPGDVVSRLNALADVDGNSLATASPGDPLICLSRSADGKTVWGRPSEPVGTLVYTMNMDTSDPTGHTIALTIDARDEQKTVGVTWINGVTEEEIIPNDVNTVSHHYEEEKLYRLTIRYTDDSESYQDYVSVPWKA